jgi:hypothetical protein
VKGIPYIIAVDDYIPFDDWNLKPVFAQPSPDGALWVILMEKVFAKLSGNYDFLNGGDDWEIFDLLGGSPHDDISTYQLGFNGS